MNRCFVLAHGLAARRRFTAFADRRALASWQASRVRRHLRAISQRSPFYREWFEKSGRGSSLILSSWPQVDKRTMVSNLDRWLTRLVDLAAAREMAAHTFETRDFARALPGGVTVGLSSGTTGPAAMFFVSARERAAWAGLALARVMRKSSARTPQRVAFFLRANSPLYESVGSRALRFAYFDLQRPFDHLTDELQTLAPTIIVAPPGTLRALAAERAAGRLCVAPARVVAVAEVFDADDRTAVEGAFSVRAEEVYQASEGFFAATCVAGALHWNEDVVHVEREELGGGRYHPVLTDFRRTLQPIEGRGDDCLRLPRADGRGTGVLFPDFVRLAVSRAVGGAMEDFRAWQMDLRSMEISLRPALPMAGRAVFLDRLQGTLETDCARAGLLTPTCRWAGWPEENNDAPKRRRVIGLSAAP